VYFTESSKRFTSFVTDIPYSGSPGLVADCATEFSSYTPVKAEPSWRANRTSFPTVVPVERVPGFVDLEGTPDPPKRTLCAASPLVR